MRSNNNDSKSGGNNDNNIKNKPDVVIIETIMFLFS